MWKSGDYTNHNCLTCRNVSTKKNNYFNWFGKCDYYFEDGNRYHCISSCPEGYSISNEDIKKYIKIINNKIESTTQKKKIIEHIT